MEDNNLYKITKKDIKRSADVLVRAFDCYPMFKYILGDKYNEKSAKSIIKYLIKYTILYGDAYADSKDINAVVLFIDFDKYNFTPIKSLRAGGLSLMKYGQDVGKRFDNFDKQSLAIHEKVLNKKHYYVIATGVNPKHQGKGIAKKLMNKMFILAKERDYTCYLETHGETNVAIYKKIGFTLVSTDYIEGPNIEQYAMVKL